MLYIEKLSNKYKLVKINNPSALGLLIIQGILAVSDEFVSITVTNDEITFIVEEKMYLKYVGTFSSSDFTVSDINYSLLKVEWGPSETVESAVVSGELLPPQPALDIPGVFAEISTLFSEYGISIFCTSTFAGNFVFVEETENFSFFEEDVITSDLGVYYSRRSEDP